MAKRVRGQRTTHRPGGHGPGRPAREAAPVRAAELPAPLVAARDVAGPDASVRTVAAPAAPTTRLATPASQGPRARTRLRSGGLEQRAQAESGWVMEDLRRIVLITALMAVGLVIAWILLVPIGIGDIY